jgi:hypothetical protein
VVSTSCLFGQVPLAAHGQALEPTELVLLSPAGFERWTRHPPFRRYVFGIFADRLADLLTLLGEKAGSFAVRPIHPYTNEPAKRVLVQAIKTGRAPLRLLPALVLHDRSADKHTPEAEAVLRGEAALGW